jgi:hypothetical protein
MEDVVGTGKSPLEKETKAALKAGVPWDKLDKSVQSYLEGSWKNKFGESASGEAGYTDLLGKNAEQGSLKGPTGTAASGEGLNVAKATANADQFKSGNEVFDKTIGGLKNLGDVLTNVSKDLKASEFSKSVKESAEQLKMPMGQFADNLVKFNSSIDRLSNVVSDLTNGVRDNLKNLTIPPSQQSQRK